MIQNNRPSDQSQPMQMEEPVLQAQQQQQQQQQCIRNGCRNQALTHNDWEDEYCSYTCGVEHCKDIFENWVKSNNKTSIVSTHSMQNFTEPKLPSTSTSS